MIDGLTRTGRSIVEVARDEDVTFLAAAIAYYAFVSLIPALLLALVVASVIGGDTLAERVLTASQQYLTPTARDSLTSAITSARGRTGATVIGVVTIAWTTLRVFRGLDIAFSRLYGTSKASSLLDQLTDATVVVIAIGFGIGVMLLIGVVLSLTRLPISGEVLGLGLLLIGLTVIFLPLYYVFPDRPVTVMSVLPGTVFAAVSWVGIQAIFQLYISAAPQYELYGFIGGILLLVTWFYVAAIAILIGATINVVRANQYENHYNR